METTSVATYRPAERNSSTDAVLEARLRLLQQSLSAGSLNLQQRRAPCPADVARRYLGCLPMMCAPQSQQPRAAPEDPIRS